MNNHGSGDFAAFFSMLNAQRGTADFRERDAAVLRQFAEGFLPDRLPAAYPEFMRFAGNGQFRVGSDCDVQKIPLLREQAENSFPRPLPDFIRVSGSFSAFIMKYGGDRRTAAA